MVGFLLFVECDAILYYKLLYYNLLLFFFITNCSQVETPTTRTSAIKALTYSAESVTVCLHVIVCFSRDGDRDARNFRQISRNSTDVETLRKLIGTERTLCRDTRS